MTFDYTNAQGILNTDANAIEFFAVSHSVLERLKFHNCNRAFYIPLEAAALGDGANWLFSSSIRNVHAQRWSNNVMDLTAFNGGISGNVLENIYCLGRDDAGVAMNTEEAIILGAWTNGVLNQINVESNKPTEAMFFDTCTGLVFNGVHFEQVEPRSNFGAFMHFAGGNHIINNVDVQLCTISVAVHGIFRADGANTKLKVTGLHEKDTTDNGNVWRIFQISGSEVGMELYADLVTQEAQLVDGSSASVPTIIKRAGFATNNLKLTAQSIISAAAEPSSGTFAQGDIIFNSGPDAQGTMGWVCTTAGVAGAGAVFGVWGQIGGVIATLANSATPTVAGGRTFLTGGTTQITNFTNGVEGQVIEIIAEHTLIITDATNIFTPTGGDLTLAPTDTLTLIQKADGKWYTLSHSDNT